MKRLIIITLALSIFCTLCASPVVAESTIGGMLGSFGSQDEGEDTSGSPYERETIVSGSLTGETVTLGAHEMLVPAGWVLDYADETTVMLSAGDSIIGLYTYALTEDVLAQYQNSAYDDVALALQTSAETGLATAGFDTEYASYTTYALSNGMPLVAADTDASALVAADADASALGEGWRVTTAIFLTDTDMGMCMVFYAGDDHELVTSLMWQAVDMYFGEQMSPAPITDAENHPVVVSENGSAALEEAKNMIEYGAYSRDMLIHMLTEYDGYTAEEAEYAADNCGADWAQEAAESVQDYADFGMSRDYMVRWLVEYDYFSQELAAGAVDTSGIDWYEQALLSAAESLEGYGESYAGMIEDMTEYQLFTLEQATYAADNCGADWNQQALQVASHHLDGTSYDGLIDLLENVVGFTHEQAVYAADNCGADWFEQAYIEAKFMYENDIVTDRDGMISQLEYNDFTHEQAVYAVDTLGL